MDVKLRWERQTGQYQNGHNGYLGKYVVFVCNRDSFSTDKTVPYMLKSRLPGLCKDLGNFATPEESFVKAEQALQVWLRNSGVTA